MKLCATVAEFNPFHNGHKYLVDSFKNEFDGTVAIMSGNFVQRGAPAIYEKFSRAAVAVRHGVDLVIELPVIYALSSAETFAEGAVKTLNATNSIDTLFFGSEAGEIEPLYKAAEITVAESELFKEKLKESLSNGLSYPRALAMAYAATGTDEAVVSSPNNILGIEYIKALIKTNSTITPKTIKRIGAAHDSSAPAPPYASASYIRSLEQEGCYTGDFAPQFTYPQPITDKQFADIILYALKSTSYEALLNTPGCSPDLAARFKSASVYESFDDVIAMVKTKSFTESRIRRVLWNLVIRNTLPPTLEPTYIRVLAMNERGCEILSFMQKNASVSVIQKASMLKDDKIFMTESRATDIYNIVAKLPSGEDYRHSPIPVR